MQSPELLSGGCAVDDRGTLSYLDDQLPFWKMRRFYVVENFSTETIRAFHGHKVEEKFVFVVSGSALVAIARMVEDGLGELKRFTLSDRKQQVLHVPAGYANGFRAL